jgi:hypothetical protein
MDQHARPGTPARFPAPDERKRIVERRNALSYALHLYLALRPVDPAAADTQRQQLILEYGLSEVQRMLDRIGRHFQIQRPSGDAEDEWLYNTYIERYRRWGGKRPLLPMEAERSLNYERAVLKTRQDYHAGLFDPGVPMRLARLSAAEERRLAELTDLLLADADLWDDLVPENPPASVSSQPGGKPGGKLGRNEPCWCGSGRKYKHCHLHADQAR